VERPGDAETAHGMRERQRTRKVCQGKMPSMSARDDDRTARQIARSKRRKAGDRSARLANTLMKLKGPALERLTLDDDLREAIKRARAVTSPVARRRAERTLAGELRRYDLVDLDQQLAKVHETGIVDTQAFHQAEHWRARLIAEGTAAIPEFPGATDDELPRLIAAAQRERDTGRPPGAARALFRYVVQALKAPPATAEDEAPDEPDADEPDEDDDPGDES